MIELSTRERLFLDSPHTRVYLEQNANICLINEKISLLPSDPKVPSDIFMS
jgi:hypothetical protein